MLEHFRLERQKLEEKSDWHANSDSKDCVKVDKLGNGLGRLWRQQICQFNNVTLDFSEAIAQVYKTPTSLVKVRILPSLIELSLLFNKSNEITVAGGYLLSDNKLVYFVPIGCCRHSFLLKLLLWMTNWWPMPENSRSSWYIDSSIDGWNWSKVVFAIVRFSFKTVNLHF